MDRWLPDRSIFYLDNVKNSVPCAGSGRFNHSPGFDAGGAHHHLLGASVTQGAHALQIGFETAFCNIVRMAHVTTYHRLFSTYFANFGHLLSPQL